MVPLVSSIASVSSRRHECPMVKAIGAKESREVVVIEWHLIVGRKQVVVHWRHISSCYIYDHGIAYLTVYAEGEDMTSYCVSIECEHAVREEVEV